MSTDDINKSLQELDDTLDRLDTLLKTADVAVALSHRGVNSSLALTAAYGLRAYLHGDKTTAIEDLSTVAEEIAVRVGSKA
jgi:hypothetical protein